MNGKWWQMTGILDGRAALVTGGSRGIGAAVAERLARDGADVAITYARSEEQAKAVVERIERTGRRGLALRADAAEPSAATRVVEGTVARFGRLDILVNNAGVGVLGPLDELTAEQIDLVLAVNVRAVLLTSQAAARHLGARGRVITIGSCIAARVAGPGATLYALSKSALNGLTAGLAYDLGDCGITVNLVQPGPIDTDMNPADAPGADAQRAMTIAGEYGTAQDVAAAVAYLASGDARYVTGAALAVDGGFTV